MISYEPFWKTIEKKNISTYKLINTYDISPPTIDRLRHNKPIRTTTIDDLCRILECDVSDIIKYKNDKDR